MILHELHQVPLQVPGVRARPDSDAPREVHRVHDLSINIELELLRRGIADSHRSRILVTREMLQLEFREAALARGTVHDLELRGRTGGRALAPTAHDRDR